MEVEGEVEDDFDSNNRMNSDEVQDRLKRRVFSLIEFDKLCKIHFLAVEAEANWADGVGGVGGGTSRADFLALKGLV